MFVLDVLCHKSLFLFFFILLRYGLYFHSTQHCHLVAVQGAEKYTSTYTGLLLVLKTLRVFNQHKFNQQQT